MSLVENLVKLLKSKDTYVAEDKLLKNKVIEDCLKLNEELLKLLFSNKEIEEAFFTKINDIAIFDKDKFIRFISNKEFLPDSYTSFKNRIGLTSENEFIKDTNDVVLNFPYKDCILEGGQNTEEKGRNEIFWNETLAPDEIDRLLDNKVFTNFKKYTQNGKEKVLDITSKDNLILKGNNLLVLHSLKKKYEEKVKLIYIDPPYNTGNDSFKYNDKFNHSTWLTFMKNRLEVAKSLLKKDGLIFVQCDDNEDSYLKILMDEIFNEDLYIATITVKSNSISGNKTQHKEKTILKNKDSILVYKNNKDILLNPQFVEKKEWDTHYNSILIKDKENKYKIKRLKEVLIEKKIISKEYTINTESLKEKKFYDFILKNKNTIFRPVNSIPVELKNKSLENENEVVYTEKDNEKMFAYNGNRLSFLSKVFQSIDGQDKMAQLLGDLWTDIDFQNTQNEGGVSLTNGKKPEKLLKRIIELTTSKNDIVLDYHLGSGTTAAVAHKLGRRFIGIEQMDYIDSLSVKRLNNVLSGEPSGISKSVNWKGGGEFIYAELREVNYSFIKQIFELKSKEKSFELFKDILENGFIDFKIDLSKKEEMIEFIKAEKIDKIKDFLHSILDKNQMYLNHSEIEDKTYNISEEDKKLNTKLYTKGS